MKNFRFFTLWLVVLGFGWILLHLNLPQASAVYEEALRLIATPDNQSITTLVIMPETDPVYQAEPEFSQSLTFVNQQTFSASNLPKILIKDFKPVGSSGEIEFVNAQDNYEFGAATWISGAQTLVNLQKEATNELDFHIDVPDNQASGSYTAALVFEDQQGASLGQHLLIINVHSNANVQPASRLEFVASETLIDLQTPKVEIMLHNPGQWHIHPLVKVNFKSSITNQSTTYNLEQPQDVGVLPKMQQAYSLHADDGQALKTFIKVGSQADWQVDFSVFCDRQALNLCLKGDGVNINVPVVEANSLNNSPPETVAISTPPANPTPTPPESTPVSQAETNASSTSIFSNTWIVALMVVIGLILVICAGLRFLRFIQTRRAAFNPNTPIKTKAKLTVSPKDSNHVTSKPQAMPFGGALQKITQVVRKLRLKRSTPFLPKKRPKRHTQLTGSPDLPTTINLDDTSLTDGSDMPIIPPPS